MQKTSDVVVLKLEGAVKGPWVEELRKAYAEWDASMPPRPADVEVHLEYTEATMAKSDG